MTPIVKSASDYGIPELADLISQAFTGYIAGSIKLDKVGFLTLLCRENIDLTLSRVLVEDDQPTGIALIARQGWSSRLAAMGIVPTAQEKKLGTTFLGTIIDQARQRGERTIVLECFEQNIRGLRLYQRAGFNIVRRLYGYSANADGITDTIPEPDLREVDIVEVAQQVLLCEIMQHDQPALPWQLSGTAIARWGKPNRAYRLGAAWAVISDPQHPTLVLRALIVPPQQRKQGHATRLLMALRAQYPDKSWVVPQICPEEYGIGFLEHHGFKRAPLHQVQMELPLTSMA